MSVFGLAALMPGRPLFWCKDIYMKTSQAGLQFIRQHEGITLDVVGDTGGHQEVGYGHDLKPGEAYPAGITADTAEFLLEQDVARCDGAIGGLNWNLNQNQWDALVDFCYECGAGALAALAAHGIDQVPGQLPRWVHAKVDGVETVLPGMVSRRADEVTLWETACAG